LRHPARQPAVNLPWIRICCWLAATDALCSTNNIFVGVDISDRAYLMKARESARLSSATFARSNYQQPVMMALIRSPPSMQMRIHRSRRRNLDWMSKIMSNPRRPAFGVLMID